MTMDKINPKDLLKERSISFSGFIYEKSQQISKRRWLKKFIIIYNGIIYVYDEKESIKPKMIVLLGVFDDIEIVDERRNCPFWRFNLNPNCNYKPVLILQMGTETEDERFSFVKIIKENIVISQELYLQKLINNESNVILSLNSTGLFPYSNNYAFYDVSEEIEINLKNILFNGTSEEAYHELFHYFHLGSFLVRQDGERQILTVQGKKQVLKYVLTKNFVNGSISVAGENVIFPNLYLLLLYYRENDIPWQNIKLTIPFKLVNRDEWL